MNKKEYWLVLVLAVVTGMEGGVVSSWFFMGEPVFAQKMPQVAKVIRAEKFELVDGEGRLHGQFHMLSQGRPVLAIYDKKGIGRVGLGLDVDGIPGVTLYDKDGIIRVGIGLEKDGEPGLDLKDKNGKRRAGIGLLPGGVPILALSDMGAEPRAVLSLSANGTAALVLFDKDGKVIWSAP